VVTEAYRVHDAVAALRANDEGWFGQLMIESHMSLRKDYNVSAEELDALVLAAQDARAVGARLTGAGFGGSVVVLVGTPRFAPVRAALEHVLAKAGKPDAEVFEVFAGGAARVEELDV
jgi:galactokinase